MTKTKAILKESIVFSGSTYFSYIFKLINSLVVRRFLDPTMMGLVSEIFLINEYGKAHHLGVLNALDREIPYYRGKGDSQKISHIKKTAFSFCFSSALLAGIGFCLASFFLTLSAQHRDISPGLLLVAVLLILELIPNYYRIILRTNNKFIFLSKFNVAASVIQTVFTFFFVMQYGYKGVLYALIVTAIIGIAFLFIRTDEKIRFSIWIDIKELAKLFKIGFPLFLYDIVRTLFLTIDRLIILFFLGRKALGLYSIGVLAYNFLTPLPRGVYNVIFPKFYEEYGKTEDIQKVKHYLVKPTMVFAYLFPLVVGIGTILLPILVKYILPQYTEGLMAAHILIVSTFFYSLIFMWGYFLIAVRKQSKMVLFNLIAVALNACFSLVYVKACKMGLNGIALSTMTSNFIYSIIIISYVFSFYTKSARLHFALLSKLYFPILWTILVVFFLRHFFYYRYVSLSGDVLHAFLMVGVLLVCHLPLVYYLNRQTGIVATVAGIVKNKIK